MAHLREFTSELARYTPKLAAALGEVEASGVDERIFPGAARGDRPARLGCGGAQPAADLSLPAIAEWATGNTKALSGTALATLVLRALASQVLVLNGRAVMEERLFPVLLAYLKT